MKPNLSELPVLLVRRDGGDVLVNYRVKDNTLVVDAPYLGARLVPRSGIETMPLMQKKVSFKSKGNVGAILNNVSELIRIPIQFGAEEYSFELTLYL